MLNPYEAPAAGWNAPPAAVPSDSLGQLRHTLVANKFQRGGPGEQWKLELYDQHVRVVDADGTTFTVIARADLPTKAPLVLLSSATMLSIAEPVRTPLGLSAPDVATLKAWLGPDLEVWMRHMLQQRRRLSLITCAVFVIMGLVESNPVLLGYGLLIGVMWLLTRVAPHRALFVVEGGLSLVFVVFLVLAIGVWGTLEWWWGFVALLALFGATFSLRSYKFFAPVR